ncbi:MAG: hypothetical protein MI919_26300 [Holophagales bacterium]|nr:hypothetical protein [Holophagales bacterium]
MSERTIPGCFKYGCFGCLGLVVLFFGLSFLLGAIQMVGRKDPTPEHRVAERSLPEAPTLADYAADRPEIVELGDGADARPRESGVGTLELDLSMGDFEIRPGEPGEPLRVSADYDSNVFELKESYSETDGRWTYRVEFGGQGGFLGMLFRGGGENVGNRVEIVVPREQPVRIVGDIGLGESKVDLTGLWIEDFDVEYGPGEHFVEVREPLAVPMRSFRSDSSMGEMEIRGLGDASPARVQVDHGMGDLFLDLQGA